MFQQQSHCTGWNHKYSQSQASIKYFSQLSLCDFPPHTFFVFVVFGFWKSYLVCVHESPESIRRYSMPEQYIHFVCEENHRRKFLNMSQFPPSERWSVNWSRKVSALCFPFFHMHKSMHLHTPCQPAPQFPGGKAASRCAGSPEYFPCIRRMIHG